MTQVASNSLIVPIQLNALYVEAGQTVAGEIADFSRLPWSSDEEDFNSSTPFLGESILSPPFQDKNFVLAEGVHLHWVLPKTHRTYPTGLIPQKEKTKPEVKKKPPAAPNRWLVTRTTGTTASWIVESDYINEHSTIYNRNAVTVPSENLGIKGQPYVYLGRQLTLEEWQKETPPPATNYWRKFGKGGLTAFGYGEMSFNTFYPNCRSVFGFFDPIGTESSKYEVLGWYSDPDHDIVYSAKEDLKNLLTFSQYDPHLLKKICDDNNSCPAWLDNLIIAVGTATATAAKATLAGETTETLTIAVKVAVVNAVSAAAKSKEKIATVEIAIAGVKVGQEIIAAAKLAATAATLVVKAAEATVVTTEATVAAAKVTATTIKNAVAKSVATAEKSVAAATTVAEKAAAVDAVILAKADAASENTEAAKAVTAANSAVAAANSAVITAKANETTAAGIAADGVVNAATAAVTAAETEAGKATTAATVAATAAGIEDEITAAVIAAGKKLTDRTVSAEKALAVSAAAVSAAAVAVEEVAAGIGTATTEIAALTAAKAALTAAKAEVTAAVAVKATTAETVAVKALAKAKARVAELTFLIETEASGLPGDGRAAAEKAEVAAKAKVTVIKGAVVTAKAAAIAVAAVIDAKEKAAAVTVGVGIEQILQAAKTAKTAAAAAEAVLTLAVAKLEVKAAPAKAAAAKVAAEEAAEEAAAGVGTAAAAAIAKVASEKATAAITTTKAALAVALAAAEKAEVGTVGAAETAAKAWIFLGSKNKYKDLRAQLLNNSFTLDTLFNLLGPLLSQTSIKQEYYRYGIQQVLNWSYTGATAYPTTSLYYSKITAGITTLPLFNKVAVGQTGTDALSAYLANELGSTGDHTREIEQCLNTLLLAGSVQNDLVDIDQNLKESEHSQGFTAVDSGLIWRIRKMKNTAVEDHSAVEGPDEAKKVAPLPETVAGLLNQLNVTQEVYQKGLEDIESLKTQLYADWCKYMNTCYPPLGAKLDYPNDDLIKEYIQWESDQLSIKESEVGIITTALTEEGCSATGPLAEYLLTAYSAVQQALTAFNATLDNDKYTYELSEVPAPRYYKPKDPVVLFAADTVTYPDIIMPTKEALQISWTDDITEVVPVPGKNSLLYDTSTVLSGLPTVKSKSKPCFESVATSWSPQILQWLAAFYPEANGSNVGAPSGEYDPKFITNNFSLEKEYCDFTAKNEITEVDALEYSGSTFMSAHTKKHLQEILRAFLLKKYPTLTKEDFLSKLKITFANPPTNGFVDPGYTAYRAYHHLDSKLILTQSIGGFNQALIQQEHNIHLPIKDPLGFSSYKAFTEGIDKALNKKTYPSPNSDDQFMPIRTGRLDISKLAFLDHFGVENKANVSDMYVAQSLQWKYAPDKVWLNPRLSQETRLNFRWLAAESNGETDVEMNSHPITSPICGWLLPNYFDDSLMVYDSKGVGLGSFSFEALSSSPTWYPFPAAKNVIPGPISAVTTGINPLLLNVLINIQNGITSDLLTKIDNAQGLISPEYYAGHDSMAILMGKPAAVVRAQVSLETKGNVVSDQGWIPFQQQLQGDKPQTDGYEEVTFKIRLGENGKLNDGLIAFWEEKDFSLIKPKPASWVDNTTNVSGDTNTTDLTLSHIPKTLTMLMDPHGLVHATSGILPVKAIRVPADQYTKALKNIEVTFKTRPILTPTTSLQLSLPQEHGYKWSWLEEVVNEANGEEILAFPFISKLGFETAWASYLSKNTLTTPTSDTVWTNLLRTNWIAPSEHNANLFQVKKLDSAIQLAITTDSITADDVTAIKSIINPKTSWKETPDLPLLSKKVFETAWQLHLTTIDATTPTADDIWQDLGDTNWIVPLLHNTTSFQVKKLDTTIKTAMVAKAIAIDDITVIERVINANVTGVTPYNPEAKFYKKQQLLEGWLKISSTDNNN
jgi:hypothetical protein